MERERNGRETNKISSATRKSEEKETEKCKGSHVARGS